MALSKEDLKDIASVVATSVVAALKDVSTQPQPSPLERQQAVMATLRGKGAPASLVVDRACVFMATDSGKGGGGEVIAPDGIPCRARVQIAADGSEKIIEFFDVEPGTARAIAFYTELHDKEKSEVLREANADPTALAHFASMRSRWVSHALYIRFKLPMIRACVGKAPSQVGHLVKWDEPAPAADEAAQ
jgi:hypothetical protein